MVCVSPWYVLAHGMCVLAHGMCVLAHGMCCPWYVCVSPWYVRVCVLTHGMYVLPHGLDLLNPIEPAWYMCGLCESMVHGTRLCENLLYMYMVTEGGGGGGFPGAQRSANYNALI